MPVSVTLTMSDLADDESNSNPGYRVGASNPMAEPTNGNQDSVPNMAITTLGAAISSTSASVITVASSARMVAGCILVIGSEHIEVISITNATTITVGRAAEGTNASTHSNGATVNLIVSWQLQCDRITHAFQTPAIPLGLPVIGQSDQLQNKMIDIGMRTETIRISGVIRDVGVPAMNNVRKQTLLDIARVSFSATINSNDQGDEASPGNINAYLKLTIGSGVEPSDYDTSLGGSVSNPAYKINTNLITRDQNNNGGTVGSRATTKSYRGMITDLTFELEGGRPDIWRYNFSFYCVKNEHDVAVA